ncbi:ABC transporter permease subunit [Bacillus weihaiensis]|uniref:ABC transporter permease subunit n=1 Tax=Bacillus weihaiensis TaxID=1547283 RepID=UPI002357F1AF|nr:ABC transporter permease subunit [Bacillus weihaiensis]
MRAILFQFVAALIGIIVFGALPSLFIPNGTGDGPFSLFFDTIKKIVYHLFHFQEMTIQIKGVEYKVYPYILDGVVYSLILLISALVVAYIASILLTLLTMQFSRRVREKIKLMILFLESLPDILVVLLLQLVIILIYKQTDVLLMKVVTVGDSQALLLPILCLALLPTIQLYRYTIHLYEEELKKDYILLGRAKGMRHTFLLVKHILRNTVVSLFFNLKKTIWFMLSTLVVVELLFGVIGITYFLTYYMAPEIFVFVLLFLFVPIFLFYHVIREIIERSVKGGETLT